MKLPRAIFAFLLALVLWPLALFLAGLPTLIVVAAWTLDVDKATDAMDCVMDHLKDFLNWVKGHE